MCIRDRFARDMYIYAQIFRIPALVPVQTGAEFLLEICAEEPAGESRRAAVLNAAHVNVDHVEREDFLAAQPVALLAHLVQNGETDLGNFGRFIALPLRERAFKNRPPKLFEKVRQIH